MKKIFKWILIIVLIVAFCIVYYVGRKVIILSKLDSSVSKLENTKDNIYIKIVETDEKGTIQAFSEVFIKGEVEKSIINNSTQNSTLMQFVYPTERKLFSEHNGKKTLSVYEETASKRTTDVNSAPSTHTVLPNHAHTMNFLEKINLALHTDIMKAKIDNKYCYELCPTSIDNENTVSRAVFVEISTGLPVKLVEKVKENDEEKEYTAKFTINFDCVTDQDMIEPNAEEYTLVEE